MTQEKTCKFAASDLQDFADLSGDWNPLHVDPMQARRSTYGQPIVHGIFVVLRLLDDTGPTAGSYSLRQLSAQFHHPVLPGTVLRMVSGGHTPDNSQKWTIEGGGLRLVTVKATLQPLPAHEKVVTADLPPAQNRKVPCVRTLDAPTPSGCLPLCLDTDKARMLFPNLTRILHPAELAELLALSRLIGMEYPGRDALFSGFTLTSNTTDSASRTKEPAPSTHLSYTLTRKDPRFRLVDLAIEGPMHSGTARAFFRHSPVNQPDFGWFRQQTEGYKPYHGWRAVIIGGTRGLGEATAKLLAAGGAHVLLTYHRGQADAERIQQDILSGGGTCDITSFDVTAHPAPCTLQPAPFTHLFYFATPPIFFPHQMKFDQSLFEHFKQFYVDGFLATAACFPDATLFYPSSVAVSEPVAGMAEYAAAKAEGEEVATQLAHTRHRPVIIERLPRVDTDQTQTLGVPVPAASAVSVMQPILQKMAHR